MKRLRLQLLWAWLLAACGSSAHAPQPAALARVSCAPASVRAWADTRALRGVVAAQPDRDAIVSAQVAGRLVRVRVREGDRVRAGAALAEVETAQLQDALRQGEALLAQARAQREAAAAAATREQHLYERGISARQSFEAARAALGQAQGACELASAQLDVARRNLERASVRAPIDGVVVRLLRREGELVDGTPATPILEVADVSAPELLASASPQDLVVLRTRQAATVQFDAVPNRSFGAAVRSVAPAVDAHTGVGAVRLSLQPDDALLPLGIVGVAQVAVAPARSVRVVPEAALRSAGGSQLEVVLCDHGRARPRRVVVGARRDGYVEIVRGLDMDMDMATATPRVVVEGLIGLEDGAAIAAVEASP